MSCNIIVLFFYMSTFYVVCTPVPLIKSNIIKIPGSSSLITLTLKYTSNLTSGLFFLLFHFQANYSSSFVRGQLRYP